MTTNNELGEEKELQVYMQEECPDKEKQKTDYIKWQFLNGKDRDWLKTDGCNPGSIRICEQELERDGLRDRPPPTTPPPKDLTTAGKVQIFARGSPPEAIIESIDIPIADGEGPSFEKGMKFGMSVLVLATRVMNELSAIGIQQAKPALEIARDMRAGEAIAARNAAQEAAMITAAQVQQNLEPYLAALAKGGGEADPMKSMMSRTMEPMMKRMMNMFLPPEPGETASGWSKRLE